MEPVRLDFMDRCQLLAAFCETSVVKVLFHCSSNQLPTRHKTSMILEEILLFPLILVNTKTNSNQQVQRRVGPLHFPPENKKN